MFVVWMIFNYWYFFLWMLVLPFSQSAFLIAYITLHLLVIFVWVCVCVRERERERERERAWVCIYILGRFRISLIFIFSVCVCVWMCVLSCFVYIYIYMCVCVCWSPFVCVYDSCFIQLSFKFICKFIFLYLKLHEVVVWYFGIILNSPWLHSYRCFDTFNFLFSSILILLWGDVFALRACIDPMYIFLHLLHSIKTTALFDLQLKRIYFEFGFRVFKGIRFTFYNCITYFALFIIAFSNPLSCVFTEWRRGQYSFKILGLSLVFNEFFGV